MASDLPEPRIVERDGNIVRIVAGDVELIAEMIRQDDELIFRAASMDGPGPTTIGLAKLRQLARIFAVAQGVRRIRIQGTIRTTGARPGKLPREIIICV